MEQEQGQKFDIAIIGHFSKDEIVYPDKEMAMPGGVVYYTPFLLQKMGLKVAIVTKMPEQERHYLRELEEEGVQTFVYPSLSVTSIRNIYPKVDNLDERICQLNSWAEPFRVEEIPKIKAKIFHIGALLSGEISLEVIKNLSSSCAQKLGLDIQGFIRKPIGQKTFRSDPFGLDRSRTSRSDPFGFRIEYQNWLEMEEALSYIDFLKLDVVETKFLTGKENMKEAAKELFSYGPKEVLITDDQGVLVYDGKNFYQAPFTPKEINGRTGRGDTCMASYLGKRLTSSPEEATKFAAAITSRKLEQPGPFKDNLYEITKK